MQLSLHFATVVDNNDTDQKSKIQVRVLPEMDEFETSKLPWLRPFFTGGMTAEQFSHYVPAVDSKIWVVFLDKYYKNGYYLTGSFIDGFFDFSKVQSDLNNIAELSDKTYQNTRFTRYSDGTVIFHNDDTGEMGVYHSSGKYVVIDNNGEVHVSGAVTMKDDVTIQGSLDVGLASEPVTLFSSLSNAMNTLLGALAVHVHTDPLTGSTGPPLPPLSTYNNGTTIGLDLAESQDTNSS